MSTPAPPSYVTVPFTRSAVFDNFTVEFVFVFSVPKSPSIICCIVSIAKFVCLLYTLLKNDL